MICTIEAKTFLWHREPFFCFCDSAEQPRTPPRRNAATVERRASSHGCPAAIRKVCRGNIFQNCIFLN